MNQCTLDAVDYALTPDIQVYYPPGCHGGGCQIPLNELLSRNVINHFRHCYTNYETLLDSLSGRPYEGKGMEQAYTIIKRRVNGVVVPRIKQMAEEENECRKVRWKCPLIKGAAQEERIRLEYRILLR